jgi:hypothetical protein
MNSLYLKFFQYLEDIGEQRVPLKAKLLDPDQFTITPEDLDVKGDLYFLDSPITLLPDNLQVGGNLSLFNTKITSLPNNLQVGGDLLLSKTPLSSKTEAEIRQMAPGIEGEIRVLNIN